MSTHSPLTDDQMLELQAWKVLALEKMPYMADWLFAFRPVATKTVATMAVDAQCRLYLNFDYTDGRSAMANAEDLLHEASHLFADHHELAKLAGVKPHEHDTWNVAADAAINDDLRDAGCHSLVADAVFAAQFGEKDYQTPLHYMDVLRRKQQQAQQRAQQQQGQGQPGQQGQSGSGGQQQPGQQGASGQQSQPGPGQPGGGGGGGGSQPGSGSSGQQPGLGGSGGQQPAPTKGCGSGAGGAGGAYELGNDDMGGYAPGMSSVEKEVIQIRTAENIIRHIKAKGMGSVPAGIKELANMMFQETKTPWQHIVGSLVRRFVSKRRGQREIDYTRRNRRRFGECLIKADGTPGAKIIVPGYSNPVPTIHLYRDTSSSVTDGELELASSEIITLSKRLGIRGNDLLIADVDTKVYGAKKFTGKDMLNTVTGRGGTNMIKAIKNTWDLPKRQHPSCIIVATDGGTRWPTEPGPVPVIALLLGKNASDPKTVPDWIHVVEAKDLELAA